MNVTNNSLNKSDSNNSRKQSFYYILILIVVLFVFQEVLFRIIFPVPEVSNFNRINYSPLFFGETSTEPKYLSNASFIWASDPDTTESLINLNIYGFRGKNFDIEKPNDKQRVVFIGDSFTEGYLAADDETIPVIFGKESESKGKGIESINLGIGGTDFSSYIKLIGGQMKVLNPDHIVIIMHGNDLPPNPYNSEYLDKPLLPERNNIFLPRFIKVLSDFFADKSIPKIWTSNPFIFFAPVPEPSNPWSNTEKTGKYSNFIRKDILQSMKNGRFNPFAYDEYSLLRSRLPQTFKITEHLSGIQNFVEQSGKKLYLVYIPSKNQVSEYYNPFVREFSADSSIISLNSEEYQLHAQVMTKACKALGIPFLDCTEMIVQQENKGNHLYWEYDAHMRPKGYKFIGKELYNWWKQARNM